MKEIGLISSHRNAINLIANDNKTSDSDWSLILEEDARLHPSLVRRKVEVQAIVSKAIAHSNENGVSFIYFGICGGGCAKNSSDELIGLDCYGCCAHAYAITKKSSASLFYDLYNNDRKDNYQIDQALYHYFLSQPNKSIVVGYNYVAPGEETHRGLLYQVRLIKRGTSLNGPTANNFTDLVQYRSTFSGRLGNLMFQHAALTGLCVKRGFSPQECACHAIQPSTNGKYSELPITQFINNFQIPEPEYYQNSLPSNVFREHKDKPYDIRFDPDLFEQPTGTSLHGYYQSYKYFHPHASQIIRETYTFPSQIRSLAAHFLADVRSRMIPNNEIVCMAVRRGDKTDATAHASYPKWALSMDYYKKAIEVFEKRYNGNIALVVFTGGGFSQNDFDTDRNWVKKTMDLWLNTLSNSSIQIFYDDSVASDHFLTMHTISQCPNIIVSSSSFVWWSAYLSGHSNIVAPRYPQTESTFVPEDYYPSTWTLLDKAAAAVTVDNKGAAKG